VKLKKVLVAMETKRTDFDNIWQDVNKVKKYASDLQTFIGVNEMTSVVDGEVKKQKGVFDMATNTFFNFTCKFCSLDTISSIVCFSIVSKWSLSNLRMVEISDKNFLFCLSTSEILFVKKSIGCHGKQKN
jgi:hypothetical protein